MARGMLAAMRGLWASGDDEDPEFWQATNYWFLTFRDAGAEAGFMSSRLHKLFVHLRICAAVTAVVNVISIMEGVLKFEPGTVQTQVLQLSCLLATCQLLLALMVVVVTSIPCVSREANPLVAEIVTVLVVTVGMWTNSFSVPWYTARLLGHDPESVLIRAYLFADTSLLLAIDTIVTVVHIALPLRSCALVFFQINAVFCYVVPAFVLGSPEEHRVRLLIVILCCLVTMAAFGKRSIEAQDRSHFLTMIREKSLRVKSEFQLSQMMNKAEVAAVEKPRSTSNANTSQYASDHPPPSVMSTTESGKAFMFPQGAAVDESAMQRIAEIGRKEQWLIDEKELTTIPEKILGRGSYGEVTLGLYHGSKVAIKAPKSDSGLTVSENKIPSLCNELRIMRHLRHPNIVHLYGASVTASHGSIRLCVILELIGGESLRSFILDTCDGRPDDASSASSQIMLDIASAIAYLHNREPVVIHGDLKDTNIFVERAMGMERARLLDFGLSRLVTKHARPLGGSVRWMAPELLRGRVPPNESADVFSFGRVVFFMVTGKVPFTGKTDKELIPMLRSGVEPTWPQQQASALAEAYRPFVQRCSEHLTDNRIDMGGAFQMLAVLTRPHQDIWQRRYLRCLEEQPSREEMLAAAVVSAPSQELPPELEDSPVAAWFDVLSPRCSLVKATEGFRLCMGRCQDGDPLLQWVERDQREAFIAWVQEEWQRLANCEGSGRPATPFPGPLRLVPQTLRRCRLGVEACAELRRLPQSSQSSELAGSLACLSLTDLRWALLGPVFSPSATLASTAGGTNSSQLGSAGSRAGPTTSLKAAAVRAQATCSNPPPRDRNPPMRDRRRERVTTLSL